MFYQFGPVYAYPSAGKQAFRVANFHLWFTGDGNGNVDFHNTALFDQAGNSSNSNGSDPNNPACILRGIAENANANGSTYNVVNHAILSFPGDMCFAFAGPGLVNVTTLQVVGTVALAKATSKVPPSLAADEMLTAAQGRQVVVMGDSYASGEGTFNKNGPNGDPPSVNYIQIPGNETRTGCHRSTAAYGPLMGVPLANFVACSGSTISDVENGAKGFGPQLNRSILSADTKLVILSATGDDLRFGNVLDACISVPIVHPRTSADCSSEVGKAAGEIDGAMTNLGALWSKIEALTSSQVKIIQVGYPHFFPPTPFPGCNWISMDKQSSLNSVVDQVDYGLFNAAAADLHVTFVDVRPTFADHPICGAPVKYINDLQQNVTVTVDGLGVRPGPPNCPASYLVKGVCSQSFHPTVPAYAAERALLWPLVKQVFSAG